MTAPAAVAALYCRPDSIYKAMGLDVFDAERDARTFEGGRPVVAHPPCRQWGRLRAFARENPEEKALGLLAVRQVRESGGVLEHPETSTLWRAAGLPLPGDGPDEFGGWTLVVDQYWFGHRARKRTWVYIVGVKPAEMPRMPLALGRAPCLVAQKPPRNGRRQRKGDPGWRPAIERAEREATPPEFAAWLVEIAARSVVGGGRK